jgi:sugar phosphate isomerase/epimerase
VSRQAKAPQIVAALPVDADRPRFALESLSTWGCRRVELFRWQVAPLSGGARLALRDGLSQAGLTAALISLTDNAGEGWSLAALRQAFELAAFFRAEGVVTTAPPRGAVAESGDGKAAAAGWLNSAVAMAEANALALLIENRPGTWAGASRDFREFIGQVKSPWLQVAFNAAGFVALREHPFLTAYMPGHLKSQMQLLRIQDAAFEGSRGVRLNEGNAEIAEVVSAALARGYSGFFGVGNDQASLEAVRLALEDFRQLLVYLGLENSFT